MTRSDVLPQRIIEKMSPGDRKELGLKTDAEKREINETKSEAQVQCEVEALLRLRGYWPRSPAFLDGKTPRRGWYVHLHKTKKNPILLDLLTMSNGRCLELELKTTSGKVRPEQEAILKSKGTALARSAAEALEIIKQWEKSNEREDG